MILSGKGEYKMCNISFTEEEKDAVIPQIACRLDVLKTLMAEAGENKDSRRVLELAKFIDRIEGFYNKLMWAK